MVLLRSIWFSIVFVSVVAALHFPENFSVDGTLHVPALNSSVPFSFQYNLELGSLKMSYDGGSYSRRIRLEKSVAYSVSESREDPHCEKAPEPGSLVSVLPDPAIFVRNGSDWVNGRKCQQWSAVTATSDSRVLHLTLLLTKNGQPVRLRSLSLNDLHNKPNVVQEEIVIDYKPSSFRPNSASSKSFSVPTDCTRTKSSSSDELQRGNELLDLVQRMVPQLEAQQTAHLFDAFTRKFSKAYRTNEERSRRMSVFSDNLRFIREYNRRNSATKLAINHFADMTHLEFIEAHKLNASASSKMPQHAPYRSRIVSNSPSLSSSASAPTVYQPHFPQGQLPPSVDWRDKGAVGPVRDQGDCGACWAFSSAAAVESHHFLATGQLVALSPQNLIDCTWNFGNKGCSGGEQEWALDYLISQRSISTEESYPYMESPSTECLTAYSRDVVPLNITAYSRIPLGDEAALADAIASYGPALASIDATHQSIVFYNSGVYYEPFCSNKELLLDHAILVVGYGTDQSGQDFWVVKNSWSQYWGQGGYLYLARNKNNHCGIATEAMFIVP